ncbi:hypothetical protein EDD16DRAFT_730703 [Pisolithus croceorrhizus]|nr:hypothetical protein EV401DRAFT_1465984 [Pisolithus croceorrhizus]KAI6122917.1 hypothetical protein EDD16DRAFT_730703 [Pisolithus croceorrhizus]
MPTRVEDGFSSAAGSMETLDWDLVFQFVSDPLEGVAIEKPWTERRGQPFGTIFGQVPTPPESCASSPVDLSSDDHDTPVFVSTTFFPSAQLQTVPPDVVLLSSDSVFFYVHQHVLLAASDNNFNSLLPPSPRTEPGPAGLVIPLSESSAELNIVLHAVYNMSCAHYSPSFDYLVSALAVMNAYGISVKKHVARSTPLYNLLLFHAPLYPLELYTLAASYDLYDLAVPASSHLLSFSLASLTDEMADRIGPRYLRRLFFLHFGRSDALRRLLLPPPHPHPPTVTCDFTDQKKLTRAWALASAYFAWDARPDLSTSSMESALAPLAEEVSCEQCKLVLRERLKTLIVQWSVVKRTI